MLVRSLTVLLALSLSLPLLSQEPAKKKAQPKKAPERPTPTAADFAYAADSPRQKFDFWQAKSDAPTPLVLLIHGGGWMGGDKANYGTAAIQPYLEWNLDPTRVGATGGSAGACTSLWLALHDDLADPKSSDPVARQSSRLTCAAVSGAQTSLDPKELREWIPNSIYGGHAFGFAQAGRSRAEEFDLLIANREKVLPWIKEYSPIELVTKDDPPIYLDYPRQAKPPVVGQVEADPTHSAMYGVKLAEKLKFTGIEVVVSYPGHKDEKYGSIEKFLIEKLTAK
jgi:acetyl esterase/lipase